MGAEMNITDIALHYKNILGFSVIPQKNKQALVPWSEFIDRKPTDDEIKKWWDENRTAGIAGIVGSISNKIVIDCDSPEAIEHIESLIPDNLTIPCVETPRGGRHYYFHCEDKIQKKVGFYEHVDLQAERSMIVMPPSVGKNGNAYKWIIEPKSANDFPTVPASLQASINNNKYIIGDCSKSVVNNTTDNYKHYNILQSGSRDDELFYIANQLIKGGRGEDFARQVLEILAKNANPPFPEKEINIKISSALSRVERRERNLSSEIREWITLQEGYFNTTDILQTLQITTKEEKKNLTVILTRLHKEGIIEKYGERRGQYKTVQKLEENIIDLYSANTTSIPLKLPLGISDLVKIMPKNIIIVAGESNAGKTAFLLNCAANNMFQHNVYYYSSEMGGVELKERLQNYDKIPLDAWQRCKFIERATDFDLAIRPDDINIIDFLEIHDEFYKIGGYVKKIFDKLNNGVAIIAIQKNKGRDEGLGGARSIEKARLYLSMVPGKIKIVKAKNWINSMINPNNMVKEYKLAKGIILKADSEWKYE
jgi:hypothetical protein